MEQALDLLDYPDYPDCLKGSCTFSYKGKSYQLTQTGEDVFQVQRLHLRFWDGSVQAKTPATGDAMKVARILMRKKKNYAAGYLFMDEHYNVTRRKGRYCLERDILPDSFSKGPTGRQFFGYMTVAIVLAVLTVLFYTHTSEISIAANLFDGMPRAYLKPLLYLIQIGYAVALLFVSRFRIEVWDLPIWELFPLNLLTLISACQSNTIIRILTILIIGATVVFGAGPKIMQCVLADRKVRKDKILFSAARRVFIATIVCVVISFVAVHYLGVSTYTHVGKQTSVTDAGQEEVYQNTCLNLKEATWEKLTDQEKLDTLQIICDYECKNTLGCPKTTVYAGHPHHDDIWGEYDHENNRIIISVDCLREEEVSDVLGTLLHETRHAYQYALIEMLNHIESKLTKEELELEDIKKALSFRSNCDNYADGSKDFLAYYHQPIEEDSRRWAVERLKSTYYDMIYAEEDSF